MVVVTRLVGHKGVDLVRSVAEACWTQGIQQRSGQQRARLRRFSAIWCHPGRVGGYTSGLCRPWPLQDLRRRGHFLMPSKSDPAAWPRWWPAATAPFHCAGNRRPEGLDPRFRRWGRQRLRSFQQYNAHDLLQGLLASREVFWKRKAGQCWCAGPCSVQLEQLQPSSYIDMY